MKFSTTALLALAANLASAGPKLTNPEGPRVIGPLEGSPFCLHSDQGLDGHTIMPYLFHGFIIEAMTVRDVPAVCNDLWGGLAHFGTTCGLIMKQNCIEIEPGVLRWEFSVGSACQLGHIQAAWYEATKNKYGALDCFVRE
ncbi:uncharacterized protein CTRU02_204619 [Colletotrichum truncatum]|uniref:Uncharacterized protein n=1 Tax=Colletotrichum truncatum TaxID=5467 RepID=A0ACC3ZCL7_COLTU|nr:uncharacterized protein CTRU02_02849 [Colletotrichum truncatum]KAF6797807.1 hypothetical protein CTRU02_02849 [Colletotrichum truncatum]